MVERWTGRSPRAPRPPSFEFEEDPHFPEAGVYRGREAFGAYGRQFMDAWETWEFDLKEVREAPAGADKVFTRFIIRGRGHESGPKTELEAGWVWTVRNGRPTRARAYLDLADALQAAGLSE